MAHVEQTDYVKSVRDKYPENFKNASVLEVGSLNLNGSVRELFTDCKYTGIDVGSGSGVDIVCEGQRYDAPDHAFDTTISCECFEHNPFWLETFFNMWRMTKPGGLVVFTCATTGRAEHGTRSSQPDDSPLSIDHGWSDYYKNLTQEDFTTPLNLEYFFDSYFFETNEKSYDLYFYGVKK